MKALTLWQPWSWAIAHAGKRVENRTWEPPASIIGQRVAIHAGLRLDADAVERLASNANLLAKRVFRMRGRDRVTALSVRDPETRCFGEPIALVFGAVESVATIAGYVEQNDGYEVPSYHTVRADGRAFLASAVVRSPWWTGPVGWVLADVIALPEPVPCRGAQGLWTLPEDVERAVLAQIGGSHG